MIIKGNQRPWALKPIYSFFKVFESLERLAKGNDEGMAVYARGLLQECEKYPILKTGFEDPQLLVEHRVLIDKLTALLSPESLLDNELKAIDTPFGFQPFYLSTRLKTVLDNAGDDYVFDLTDVGTDLFYHLGCSIVLTTQFKFPIDIARSLLYKIPNKKTGITRTYKVAYNANMIEVLPTEKSKLLSHDDCLELMDNFDNIQVWKAKIPENTWIARGIGIINLQDVTMDASLADITSHLLASAYDNFDNVQSRIKNMFNNNELDIGLMTYENGVLSRPANSGEITSILLKTEGTLNCEQVMCRHTLNQLINQASSLAIADVERFDNQTPSGFSQTLRALNYESYVIAPLRHNGQIFAFLEVGSRKKHELNNAFLIKIDAVLPILAMATSRFRTETANLREAIIQQKCTTIHPSVKWRFEEEANRYIKEQRTGGHPSFGEITFEEVYALFGQMDIKDSSTIRNQAVQADLSKQINAVKEILEQARQHTKAEKYDRMVSRLDGFEKSIMKGMLGGSEQKLLGFINSKVCPLFEQLKTAHPDLAMLINQYREMLHPELNMVYEMRQQFDESSQRINDMLATHLDKAQEEAQKIFPHYYERFKTDGVDHNIYIGDSLAQLKNYDRSALHRLRFWQLTVMCEMERKFRLLQKDLSISLEVASLILVYPTPLAIHFRMDEKKFDVKGAYNARYQIVKKRVEKAHIKGTSERITTPGKIAIVFSSEEDIPEYRTFISHLEQKNYIKPNSLEELDIEDLQGITALKALRVEMP